MIPIDKCLSQSNKIETEINEAEYKQGSSVLDLKKTVIHLYNQRFQLQLQDYGCLDDSNLLGHK
jgi:hypothetical protein